MRYQATSKRPCDLSPRIANSCEPLRKPFLSIESVHKRYAAPVLQGIDLDIFSGEVHALVGANGAGKTTLCNIICGIAQADTGNMRINGAAHTPTTITTAQDAGIRMVMQELNLFDNLSIAENLYFDALPNRHGLINYRQLNADAQRQLHAMGINDVDPETPVRELGIGQQQLIEIGRALVHPCRLLILDEPTAALTDPQIDLLFEKIALLKSNGTAIIYVSHRMDEIQRIADAVSVMRDGQVVLTAAANDVTTDQIISHMTDEPSPEAHESLTASPQSTALTLRGLSTSTLLHDINLDIRFGEILGIAGLMGSGRSELLRAIFGADAISAGTIHAGDGSLLNIRSPADAIAHGIGLIPEDRKQQGLLLTQSIAHNITLATLARFKKHGGWVDTRKEDKTAKHFETSLNIVCDDIQQTVAQLSGGNQQKVSIAKWLVRDCPILLFDEPTRGIDINAKTTIYALLRNLAERGVAVVIVSSESRELTDICDRIAVLSNGRLSATFDRGDWSAERIMAASFSGYRNTSHDNAA